MKRAKNLKIPSSVLFIVLIMIGFGAGYGVHEFGDTPQVAPLLDNSITVCFTPNKQCQSQILGQIENAKKSIFVQAYSFTDKDIASALVNAARRGVAVKVLLDRSNRKDDRSAKDIILGSQLPLRFDAPSGIAHNKIIIIDEATIISGSYNFSAAAYKRNTENLLVITNPSLAHQYIQNWQTRWRVSE